MKIKIKKITKRDDTNIDVVFDLDGEEKRAGLTPLSGTVDDLKKFAKQIMELEVAKRKGFVNYDEIKKMEGEELCLDDLQGLNSSCGC